MTSRGESAVLVLAAGAGTRMRSDIPKVLHTIAGRSMLSHVLHAVAKVAPQHLVVVVGQRPRADRAGGRRAGRRRWAARSSMAVQERAAAAPATPSLCGLSALPDDFDGVVVVTSGDVPLLDADTLADLIDDPQRRAGRGDGADHHPGRPDRLRPHPAHPGPRGDRDRRTGRRHAVAAGDPRGQRRRLRLRHRRAALGAEPAALRQRPARAVPHRRHRDPARGRHRSCTPSTSTTARWWPASTTACSWPTLAAELNRRIVAAHQRAGVTDHRPGHHVDRRRRHHRPRHRRSGPAPSCSAPPASARRCDDRARTPR